MGSADPIGKKLLKYRENMQAGAGVLFRGSLP